MNRLNDYIIHHLPHVNCCIELQTNASLAPPPNRFSAINRESSIIAVRINRKSVDSAPGSACFPGSRLSNAAFSAIRARARGRKSPTSVNPPPEGK